MKLKVSKSDQSSNTEMHVYYSEEHIYTLYFIGLDEHLSIEKFLDNLYWILKLFNSSKAFLRGLPKISFVKTRQTVQCCK